MSVNTDRQVSSPLLTDMVGRVKGGNGRPTDDDAAWSAAVRPKRSIAPSELSIRSGPHTGHFYVAGSEHWLPVTGNANFRP